MQPRWARKGAAQRPRERLLSVQLCGRGTDDDPLRTMARLQRRAQRTQGVLPAGSGWMTPARRAQEQARLFGHGMLAGGARFPIRAAMTSGPMTQAPYRVFHQERARGRGLIPSSRTAPEHVPVPQPPGYPGACSRSALLPVVSSSTSPASEDSTSRSTARAGDSSRSAR